ncbi:SH3 domain-containing protein [Oceanobacillus damuensis]|uniref:SH3 domain-containing protein n=1 Tax=Oceanobacillus damuensis TaxID=937928 RepID=UPI00082E3F4C|nr:SH3 domain-containing protein [Oceanobacillus damuensis]
MNRKGILFTILLILSAGFIAFVAIMQHNFMNPEFQVNSQSGSANEHQDTTESEDDHEEEGSASVDETDREQAEESEEDNRITHSKRIVNVDSLNVRSGPGTEYEISGILTLNQEVDVEDDGSEWLKVTTPHFTGFVNEKYLTEEQ